MEKLRFDLEGQGNEQKRAEILNGKFWRWCGYISHNGKELSEGSIIIEIPYTLSDFHELFSDKKLEKQ